VVKQLAKDFAGLEVEWGEDGLEALQQAGIQQRLALVEEETSGPTHRKPRLAVVEGFRLHADTGVHAHDRQGLMRLCRYGSRGPVAEERLSRREDGRYEYRTKRGPTLVLTGAQLVKRLLALVLLSLTLFHHVVVTIPHPPRFDVKGPFLGLLATVENPWEMEEKEKAPATWGVVGAGPYRVSMSWRGSSSDSKHRRWERNQGIAGRRARSAAETRGGLRVMPAARRREPMRGGPATQTGTPARWAARAMDSSARSASSMTRSAPRAARCWAKPQRARAELEMERAGRGRPSPSTKTATRPRCPIQTPQVLMKSPGAPPGHARQRRIVFWRARQR